MPLLFEGLDPERSLTVLDIGVAKPESVRFFSRYRCRLHFADLCGETGYDSDGVRRHGALKDTLFERIFEFPRNTTFDVCLFWDFLNYLGTPLLRDFAKTLRRYVHDDTRSHAFVPFSNALPFVGHRFGLESVDRLSMREDPSPVPHPHTRKTIAPALWPFSVKRAALLGENRQELLLEIRRI